MDHSTFINNQVIGADTPPGTEITTANFGVGGAIENNAGFGGDKPSTAPSTATISNSTFTDNLATAGTDSTANGGAIGNECSGATVILINSTLTGNRAIGGPGSNNERTVVVSQGIGGGISNSGGSRLTVMNSTLSGNQAIAGDHSIPTLANPLTGAGIGGGIANFGGGELTVTNSRLNGNLAQGGAGAVGLGGSGAGGGIENSFSSTATITNSTLSGNRAIAGPGGSGASVPTGLGFGGGIDDSFNATATITNSTLIGNQAIGSDGSYGANGGAGWGGGIVVGINNFLGYDPADFQPDKSSLIVSGSTLIGNLAQGGAGGSGANGGNGWGGGLMIAGFVRKNPPATGNASATVEDTSITGNQAVGGAAGARGMPAKAWAAASITTTGCSIPSGPSSRGTTPLPATLTSTPSTRSGAPGLGDEGGVPVSISPKASGKPSRGVPRPVTVGGDSVCVGGGVGSGGFVTDGAANERTKSPPPRRG